MLKFEQEQCQCGLNLSTANPVDEIFKKDEAGKVIAFGTCPKCGQTNPMVKVEDTAMVEADVKVGGEATATVEADVKVEGSLPRRGGKLRHE